MKVLIVNKFLYPRGGDCIHSLSLQQLLLNAGHDVRLYAMDYPMNLPLDDSRFFAPEVDFASPGLIGKVKAASRIVWGAGVKDGFEKLLDEFHPDVVHLNNIHSQISPIVAKLAHRRGAKVIWTLHDYKLICPSYSCLCHGNICEACFGGEKGAFLSEKENTKNNTPTSSKHNVILKKCMKNSLPASLLAWAEAINWRRSKLSAWTDTFICPSSFMAKKMSQAGFPADKLKVISNFIKDEQAQRIASLPVHAQEKAYAYIGRISEEKGVESLLKVASSLPHKLYIAGGGPQETHLREKYASSHIVFMGHLSSQDIINLIKRVSFTVIPSICYENNPLSVIESLCCGTPVLGRSIGGIPELLEVGGFNLSFTHDDELPRFINRMFDNAHLVDRSELSSTALQRFSQRHYYEMWHQIATGK